MASHQDILSPTLAGDKRVNAGEPVLRRVYSSELYEVFAALYPGGLLATLVHYRRENLRIMSRLGEAPSLSSDQDAWVQAALSALKAAGKGPFHLILEAKLECRATLTLHGRAALKMAGVEVPKSAGRFREMFGNQS